MLVSLLVQKALNIQLKRLACSCVSTCSFLKLISNASLKTPMHLFLSTDCKHACRTDTANTENNKNETDRFVKLCFVKSKQRVAKCLYQNDKMTISLFPVEILCDVKATYGRVTVFDV